MALRKGQSIGSHKFSLLKVPADWEPYLDFESASKQEPHLVI